MISAIVSNASSRLRVFRSMGLGDMLERQIASEENDWLCEDEAK